MIEHYIEKYNFYKNEKELADIKLKEFESKIVDYFKTNCKEEGVNNFKTEKYKIAITNKINRKLIKEDYEAIKNELDNEIDPVLIDYKLDLKKLKSLKDVNKEQYRICAKFLESKPAKPSLKIEKICQ